MDELTPCLAAPAGASCDHFRDEISDVESLRSLLQAFVAGVGDDPAPTASGVFVVFHNLVTSNVALEFTDPARHNYYCATEAMQKLSRSLVPEADKVVLSLPLGLDADRFPGFGAHRLVKCTVR
mmetsp:Transcript_1577/g.6236  ORF Transcript_1577/g.6236 Transcript_1577/m.6236 type:complete len:124 (-) Transcript_1577:285-656(-)